jgi:hypothetical protein
VAVERGLIYAVGDALIALIDFAWPRAGRRVEELLEKVANVVRPDPPMTIRTLDGDILTGLLVADRGQVVLFIGTRVPSAGPGLGPIPMGPSHQDRRPSRFEDDGAFPPWARDLEVDPYRRR